MNKQIMLDDQTEWAARASCEFANIEGTLTVSIKLLRDHEFLQFLNGAKYMKDRILGLLKEKETIQAIGPWFAAHLEEVLK